MNNHDKMEVILIGATWTLCIILLSKILFRLRSTLPWRVNCWFCNSNSWVKYPEHNSWTCPHCEQYNGFTKDGDYNKILTTANAQPMPMTPRAFHKSPPKNGLCKMCNINQQLKVAQLANFIPMNEKKFDEEIETYREKSILLGTKLLESRTPEKKTTKNDTQATALQALINNTSMLITIILFLLISYEFYTDLMKNKNLSKTITNVEEIIKALVDRVYSIIKMYMFLTFPSMESYIPDVHINTIDMLPKTFNFRHNLKLDDVNLTTQKALGGFVCLIQIVANIWNVNSVKHTIIIDLLWSIFVISIGEYIAVLNPVITRFIKSPIKKMKKLTNASMNGFLDNDETSDTDDDVSLSKFGVHNLSESSNETASPLNASILNGRCFSPKNNSIWSKPKLNSTFCVGSVHSQSQSTIPDTVFAKPSFDSYRKLAKDDSDSDLDQSISCLSIGPTKSKKKKVNPVFLLRKFTATPSFRAPMPTSRPLLSPSKLGHTASWVAGGYWGSDGEEVAKQQNIVTTADASRSSSQSSGFESQTSSLNQRNLLSQPTSREPSIGVEPMVLDRFPNMSNLSSYITPNNFSRISSPVFPQMQFNNHVHIPRAQFSQPSVAASVYSQQTQRLYNQGGMFNPPGGSGLIKLPPVNTLSL
ncbi:Uncharacterized protein OBRU01_00120 [Operophtera brumata]|uniref:Ima1 N-terminal domain-containing protein n=1 Tax=Operophtera brumata TaxID=104452 RepID=A0A0L7LUX4_OPEBR|nr:Uncharacterized protein OBRU01_00120 [Operophtera brumata]